MGDKPLEISVKVGDKEVSIKAKSRQELLESEKTAKDLLAAMGGDNVLGLRDEDVALIELEITFVKEAEYQEQLQIQKQKDCSVSGK